MQSPQVRVVSFLKVKEFTSLMKSSTTHTNFREIERDIFRQTLVLALDKRKNIEKNCDLDPVSIYCYFLVVCHEKDLLFFEEREGKNLLKEGKKILQDFLNDEGVEVDELDKDLFDDFIDSENWREKIPDQFYELFLRNLCHPAILYHLYVSKNKTNR